MPGVDKRPQLSKSDKNRHKSGLVFIVALAVVNSGEFFSYTDRYLAVLSHIKSDHLVRWLLSIPIFHHELPNRPHGLPRSATLTRTQTSEV